MPPPDSSPWQLFVEGRDDRFAIINLLSHFDWDTDRNGPFTRTYNGVDRLLKEIPVALKSHHARIGVVIDADLDLADRWAQLKSRVHGLGIDLPSLPEADGTVVAGLRPGSRVGFWLMPDNSSPGILENFLGKLVPAGDSCWAYADEAVTEARRRGAPCKERDHPKSVLHTWLAWQEEPGLPFGTALKAKIFAHDGEDALRFVHWFNRLFVDA